MSLSYSVLQPLAFCDHDTTRCSVIPPISLPEAAPAVWIQPKIKRATKRKSHTRARSCFPRQKQGTEDACPRISPAEQPEQSAAVDMRVLKTPVSAQYTTAKTCPASQTEKVLQNPPHAPRFLRGEGVKLLPTCTPPKAHNKSPKDHHAQPTTSDERVFKTPVSFSARMPKHTVATDNRHSKPIWPGFPTCPRWEPPWSRKWKNSAKTAAYSCKRAHII